jgi:hypothetical protein
MITYHAELNLNPLTQRPQLSQSLLRQCYTQEQRRRSSIRPAHNTLQPLGAALMFAVLNETHTISMQEIRHLDLESTDSVEDD